jgi:hypothetical protein
MDSMEKMLKLLKEADVEMTPADALDALVAASPTLPADPLASVTKLSDIARLPKDQLELCLGLWAHHARPAKATTAGDGCGTKRKADKGNEVEEPDVVVLEEPPAKRARIDLSSASSHASSSLPERKRSTGSSPLSLSSSMSLHSNSDSGDSKSTPIRMLDDDDTSVDEMSWTSVPSAPSGRDKQYGGVCAYGSVLLETTGEVLKANEFVLVRLVTDGKDTQNVARIDGLFATFDGIKRCHLTWCYARSEMRPTAVSLRRHPLTPTAVCLSDHTQTLDLSAVLRRAPAELTNSIRVLYKATARTLVAWEPPVNSAPAPAFLAYIEKEKLEARMASDFWKTALERLGPLPAVVVGDPGGKTWHLQRASETQASVRCVCGCDRDRVCGLKLQSVDTDSKYGPDEQQQSSGGDGSDGQWIGTICALRIRRFRVLYEHMEESVGLRHLPDDILIARSNVATSILKAAYAPAY